jgi:molybdopterin-guanine dinucleotide biosynthesis protein A
MRNNRMIRVFHLCLSPGHNFFGHHQQPPGEHRIVEVDQIECVAGQGLRGDRFFGFKENYKGQITFFSMEVFDGLRRELNLPAAQPSATRRNVFLRGLDLNALVAKGFEIQGVRFAGVEECRPCYWMNSALGPGAEAWLKGRGGLRAQILTDGVLRCGPDPGPLSAVILAGGQSRRMGFDKAGLELDGQSLLARAVARLREMGVREIFISGRADRDDAAMGCPVLLDRQPGLGPVAGIERALQAATLPLVLVLAVDLPYITAAFLHKLAGCCDSLTGVVPEWNGELEPLVAVYPKSCQGIASAFLADGRRAAREFAEVCLREHAVRVLPADPDEVRCFANWNAPADARPTRVPVDPASMRLQPV